MGALGLWAAAAFTARMPVERIRTLRTEDYRAMYAFVSRMLTGEALEAELHRLLSASIVEALTGNADSEQLTAKMNLGTTPRGTSQLWRLQLAAGRIWLLENKGAAQDQWWPAVRGYLEGLKHARFQHRQQKLADAWAAAYRNAGVDEGTAAELGGDFVGNPHGPFLQYFVERMRRLIDERRTAGDIPAARLCERILLALLKDWILEDGPAGPRLLAVDLLEQFLLQHHLLSNNIDIQAYNAMLRDLSAWRQKYLGELKRRPIAILSPHPAPALVPGEHERLLRAAAMTSWLTAACAAAAGLSLMLLVVRVVRRKPPAPLRSRLRVALVEVFLVCALGLGWICLLPESVRTDFRNGLSGLPYAWRHSFVSVGSVLLLSMLGAVLRCQRGSGQESRLARWEIDACLAWGGLTLVLLLSLGTGELTRRQYERELRSACENPLIAVLGAESEQRLEKLRQWKE